MKIQDLMMPIYEAVGSNRLYHWTGYGNIGSILHMNKLLANKSQFSDVKGVSFSRLPLSTGIADQANSMIVVDRDRLAQNYRLIPRAGDMQKAQEYGQQQGLDPINVRKETEEMVPSDVEPLSRYMTHLCLPYYIVADMLFQYTYRATFKAHDKPFPPHLLNYDMRTMDRLAQYPHVGIYLLGSEDHSNPSWVRKLDSESFYPFKGSPLKWKEIIRKHRQKSSDTEEFVNYVIEFLDWFSEHPEYLAHESA